MARYETLLEADIYESDEGRGVVQIVSEEESAHCELRFCYYNADGRFTNRPLTLPPDRSVMDRARETMENLGFVARTLEPGQIERLVERLGEQRVIELAHLIDVVGEAGLAEMLAE